MSEDLKDVPKAFAWLDAYFSEVSKVCKRVVEEFATHHPDYEDASTQQIEFASSVNARPAPS